MLRSALIFLIAYGWGHGHFDGYRPHLLDKPLEGFHAEVNIFARDSERALVVLNEARTMAYVRVVAFRMGSEAGD